MKHNLCIIFSLIVTSSCTVKSAEDRFSSNLQAIVENETWLIGQNDRAIDKIVKLIEDNPASLDYQIRPLKTDDISREYLIDIITSDDGNVRVYNLNNIVENGNHSFGPDGTWIIQYRIDGNVYTDVWGDKYSSVTYIHSVQSSAKTYYLFVDYSDYLLQGVFMVETITAYSINPRTHRLQEEPLFKTTCELLSSIDISWRDSVYTEDNTIYSELHHIDCNYDELRIPLVANNGVMTEGYLLYLWDGVYFKFKGIEPIVEFRAKDWTVRIDILLNGKYKYSSWGKNKSTCMSPDLVLYNGEMTCWDETGMCDCNAVYDNDESSSLLGREYSFKNNEYLYCFEYGWWKGHFREYFTITKGEKELLSTKTEIIQINNLNY